MEIMNYIFFVKRTSRVNVNNNDFCDPKNDPSDTDIKRWRPISLPCVDYKIITKALTNGLLPTLDEIISIVYILNFDQEKAFDKVD